MIDANPADNPGERRAAYALIAPAWVMFVVLLAGPSLAVVVLSLTDWQLGAPTMNFIGFGNYEQLFADRVFWKSFGNTFVYCLVVVPGSVFLGLGLALLIEGATFGRAFYRAAYFLPVTSTLIAMAVVWEFMLASQRRADQHRARAGRHQRRRLAEEPQPRAVHAGRHRHLAVGRAQHGAVHGRPEGDPARPLRGGGDRRRRHRCWERFRCVTWPMLGPATLFVTVVSGIRSFQVFDTVEVLTKGGPNKATEVLLYTMYTEAFNFFRTGYGAAITVVFLVVVLALTLLQVKAGEKRTHYA